MSRLKDSKNVYDNIPIPDRLEETSRQWIAGTGKNGEGGAE